MAKKLNGAPLSTVQGWRFIERLNNGDPVPYHGDCAQPRHVEVRGVQSHLLARISKEIPDHFDHVDGEWINLAPDAKRRWQGPPMPRSRTATAYLSVRCRKCPECLRAKARSWAHRAHAECRVSSRTWFLTLTVAPAHRFTMTMRAQKRLSESFAKQPLEEQARHIREQLSQECTRWLKRVRKVSNARLRYLLVMEPHADGFPHVHALVHEVTGRVTKRQLESAWWLGHSKAKLVDNPHDKSAAWYVCKYITKDNQTRPRASIQYGQVTARVAELLVSYTKALGVTVTRQRRDDDPSV